MLAYNILNLFVRTIRADSILPLKTGKKFGTVGDISIAVKSILKHTDLGKKNMDKAGYLEILNFDFTDNANVQNVFKSINCQQIFYIKKGSVFYRNNTSYVLTEDKPLRVAHMECNVEMKNMKEVLVGRTRAPAPGAGAGVVQFSIVGVVPAPNEPVRYSAVLCARAQTSFSFNVNNNVISELNSRQFLDQLEYFTKDPNANNLVIKKLNFPAPVVTGGVIPSKADFFGADLNRNVFFLSEDYLTNMDVAKKRDVFEFEVSAEITNSGNVAASLEADGYLMLKSNYDAIMAGDKTKNKVAADKKIKQQIRKYKEANKKPLTSSEAESESMVPEEEEAKPAPAPEAKPKILIVRPKKEHKKVLAKKAPKKVAKKEESINWTLWGIVIGIGSVIVILMIFAGVMIANRK